jgi:hypothetical protein
MVGSTDSNGDRLPFQIVRFAGVPVEGATTFTTLGLSRVPLQDLDGRSFHQELIFGCHKRFESWNIPALLQQLGHQALSAGRVFLRGESVGPRGPLFPSSSLEGIYFALPVYWPDDLSVFKPGADGAIQMSWALPVFPSELDLVRRHGCSQFEDVLSAEDPDLLDLTRGAVV